MFVYFMRKVSKKANFNKSFFTDSLDTKKNDLRQKRKPFFFIFPYSLMFGMCLFCFRGFVMMRVVCAVRFRGNCFSLHAGVF